MYTTYELVDPRDDIPFYVGITDDVYNRFSQHVHCIGNNHAKNARIQELKALQLVFIMRTVVQTPDAQEARRQEKQRIRYHMKLGTPLTNIAEYSVQEPPAIEVPTGESAGRRFTKQKTLEVLIYVQQHKKWPGGVSKQMQRYYRRKYPEYFRKRRRKAAQEGA